MNRIEFSEQFIRVMNNFGSNFYTEERKDSIWHMVREMEKHEFRKVVDHLITTFRQAPLPSDFFNATAGYRKSRFAQDDGPTDPDCPHCLDVGFFRVRYHDDTNAATLMRCGCIKGENHPNLFIPTWEPAMAQIFKWQPCPLEWFLPKKPLPNGEFEMKSIMPIVDQWRARLRTAHDHWSHLAKAKSAKELGAAP